MTIAKRNGHFPFILDDFLNRQYNPSLADYSNTNTTIPTVNIKEFTKNFVVEVVAPDMNKKDFNVQVNSNVLTIRSEKNSERRWG